MSMGEETVTLIARFKVDGFEPRQVAGLDADWFSLLTFAKTFTSGIIGTATTLLASAGTEEGSRSYVATERITGRTDDGREGSVTVQHGGLESDPGTWFGHIVPGTGTGGFTGWSGSARIVHDDQGAYFEIILAGADARGQRPLRLPMSSDPEPLTARSAWRTYAAGSLSTGSTPW
jgi:hypothetical protein